jgi:hypothetical protein
MGVSYGYEAKVHLYRKKKGKGGNRVQEINYINLIEEELIDYPEIIRLQKV